VDQAAAEAEEVLIMHAARLLQQSAAVRGLCRTDNMFYDIILQSLLGNTQIVTCNRPRPPLITVAFYPTEQSPERGGVLK
jgi:hypothetical protein